MAVDPVYIDPQYFRGGGCSRCRRADKLIDADIHIEYEGPLAICTGCIADLALKAGYWDEEKQVPKKPEKTDG